MVDQNVYALHACQIANDFGIDPRDGCELARPVRAIVRPRDPCSFVRLPFARHAIAKRAGSLGSKSASLRQGLHQKPLCDRGVGVDATVTPERPVATNILDVMNVYLSH